MSLLVLSALILGIGVNSGVFSVVNSVLLSPVPLLDANQLVLISAKSQQSSTVPVSYPEFQDWKAQNDAFQDMAAYEQFLFNLKGNGHPEQLRGVGATASLFDTLGWAPVMGRGFSAMDEDPGAERVAVISNGLWKRRFGKDPAILGKTITLDSQSYSIIGVLPPNDFPLLSLWDVCVSIGPFLNERLMSRETRYFSVVARLKPSVNVVQAQNEMETITARMALQYPKSNKDMSVSVIGLKDSFVGSVRGPLELMEVASGLVLLLACVNVVTVFIAGAIERRKELSLRLALGAARSVILRQLFVQSLIFAAVGAGLGLLLAKAGLIYLMQKFPRATFGFQKTTLDLTVVAFTICVALGSTLISTILPSLYVTRLNINTELKGDASILGIPRRRSLGQAGLIAFEVTLAACLSLVSGLLIKSYFQLEKVNLGFNPNHVVSFLVWLPENEYQGNSSKAAFYRQAVENLRTIPGVRSVSATYSLPLVTQSYFINLQVDSDSPHASERPFVDADAIMPGYLATMKIPILQGRDFTEQDRADAPPVAIVDEELAARMWPGQNPLGKRLRLADITDNGPPWREIVGIVPQVKFYGPEQKPQRLQVYEPAYQHPTTIIYFVLNTATPLGSLRPSLESAIQNVAPDLPLQFFTALDNSLEQLESNRKISLLLLSGFAAIGIALGMICIYGIVSNAVASRRREIAIRMALGASVKNSILLVTKSGILAALAGIAFGSILVVCFTKLLTAFLFGVTTLDPGIYLISAVTILILASVASLIPAAALLRLSPQDVLRE